MRDPPLHHLARHPQSGNDYVVGRAPATLVGVPLINATASINAIPVVYSLVEAAAPFAAATQEAATAGTTARQGGLRAPTV